MDNLNTHSENALVETFGPVEGRRIWARFTVHYTPKHGSWLNQAEIAIGVMVRCALGTRRFSTLEAVRDTVTKFWKARRAERWKINWRFSVKKAKRWLKTFGSEQLAHRWLLDCCSGAIRGSTLREELHSSMIIRWALPSTHAFLI